MIKRGRVTKINHANTERRAATSTDSTADQHRCDRRSMLTKSSALGAAALLAAFPRDLRASESAEPQIFSGGSHGSLLYRDTGNSDGANWLPDVTEGSLLVSGGGGSVPRWTDSPTLKTIVSSAVEPVYPYSVV